MITEREPRERKLEREKTCARLSAGLYMYGY